MTVPVTLKPATTRAKRIQLRMLNPETGARLKKRMVDSETEEEVEHTSAARGYEYDKGPLYHAGAPYYLLPQDDMATEPMLSSGTRSSELTASRSAGWSCRRENTRQRSGHKTVASHSRPALGRRVRAAPALFAELARLGHLPYGSAAATAIYAPYEPGFLNAAVAAIEAVMAEVRSHFKRAQIDRPDAVLGAGPVALILTGMTRRRGIGEEKREEVRQLILAGVPHEQVVAMTAFSDGTVSQIRKELKAVMPIYRASPRPVCAPRRRSRCIPHPKNWGKAWWARQDSNLRQHRYERRVLTN
jgi:hypothetical protein